MLIACRVAPSERDAWSIARQNLRTSLTRASQRDWPVELSFVDSIDALMEPKPDIAVISLLTELEGGSLVEVAERLRTGLHALDGLGVAVFLCTVFRACDDPSRLERIRRLDLLAAQLSHETGCGVIDFDRSFAHTGARPLETDYLMRGSNAARLAALTIFDALLSAGLDDAVPADVLQRAQQQTAVTP